MTFDEIRTFGLTLAGVEDGTSYATPALKMCGHLMARYRPDLNAVAVATTFEERDELMREQPDIYFITDHYLEYPWVLVHLEKVQPGIMRDLLQRARQIVGESVPPKRPKKRKATPGW